MAIGPSSVRCANGFIAYWEETPNLCSDECSQKYDSYEEAISQAMATSGYVMDESSTMVLADFSEPIEVAYDVRSEDEEEEEVYGTEQELAEGGE